MVIPADDGVVRIISEVEKRNDASMAMAIHQTTRQGCYEKIAPIATDLLIGKHPVGKIIGIHGHETTLRVNWQWGCAVEMVSLTLGSHSVHGLNRSRSSRAEATAHDSGFACNF
jgi:hypothetical protein